MKEAGRITRVRLVPSKDAVGNGAPLYRSVIGNCAQLVKKAKA